MILEAVLLVQFMVKIKVIYVNMREKYHIQLQNILSAILHTCLLLLITMQKVSNQYAAQEYSLTLRPGI